MGGQTLQHSNVAPHTRFHQTILIWPQQGAHTLVTSIGGIYKKNVEGWRCNSIPLGFEFWRLLLSPLLFLRPPELYLWPSLLAFVRAPCLGSISWLGWVVSAGDDCHFDVVSQGGKRLDDQATNVARHTAVSPGGHTTPGQGDHQHQQNPTCKRNYKCLGKRPLPRICQKNGYCFQPPKFDMQHFYWRTLPEEDGKQRGESRVCGQLRPAMEELAPSSRQSSQVVTFCGQGRSWDNIWRPHNKSRARSDSGGTV